MDAPLSAPRMAAQSNISGQRGTRRKAAGPQRGRAALARHGACARSARRPQNPSFSKTRFFHSGQFRALRGAGETDPTATLAAHATAAGTTGPTGPTNPERVDDVRVLVSSSDIERTDLAPVVASVYRIVLRVSKVRVARAVEAVRVGVSHHQNDLLRKRSRDGSSVQAYAYGVPGDCLRRADASFTPIHEV